MAEQMSEEITKVMDEQRDLELEYARLVKQRDQLKGISNKAKLIETKAEIMVSQSESRLSVFETPLILNLFLAPLGSCKAVERVDKEAVSPAAKETRRGRKRQPGPEAQEVAHRCHGQSLERDERRLDLQQVQEGY